MDEANIRKYAKLMRELDLTGLDARAFAESGFLDCPQNGQDDFSGYAHNACSFAPAYFLQPSRSAVNMTIAPRLILDVPIPLNSAVFPS